MPLFTSGLGSSPGLWAVSLGFMSLYSLRPARRLIWNKTDLDFNHFPLRFSSYKPVCVSFLLRPLSFSPPTLRPEVEGVDPVSEWRGAQAPGDRTVVPSGSGAVHGGTGTLFGCKGGGFKRHWNRNPMTWVLVYHLTNSVALALRNSITCKQSYLSRSTSVVVMELKWNHRCQGVL